MITTLAGGVGAARMLRGLLAAYGDVLHSAVVNIADDEVVNGLAVSPDIDTVIYTLAGANDDTRGWGLQGETWQAMESLRRYTTSAGRADLGWFNLGDRDLGTHLYRTSRLAEGASLSTVTAEMTAAWNLDVRIVPVTDDHIATRLTTAGVQASSRTTTGDLDSLTDTTLVSPVKSSSHGDGNKGPLGRLGVCTYAVLTSLMNPLRFGYRLLKTLRTA